MKVTLMKHDADLLTESEDESEDENSLDRTVDLQVLIKPQIFSLYKDEHHVGSGSYHAERKYEDLPKSVSVYLTHVRKEFQSVYTLGDRCDWDIVDLKKGDSVKGRKPKRKKIWARHALKKLKSSGKEYISRANKYSEYKVRWKKERKPRTCRCKFTACADLSDDELKNAFQKYYEIDDQEKQKLNLIANMMVSKKKTQKTNSDQSRRQRSIQYYINGKRVCKDLFQRTFDVSAGMLSRLVEKKAASGGVLSDVDGRGKHYMHRKIGENVIHDLKSFIAKLPKYTSHYGREKSSDPSVLTLAPGLTKTKL